MKFNKMMFAALAFSAMALVACKKGNDDPVVPPTPDPDTTQVDPPAEEEIPEVTPPAAGNVTFVIQIPENSECNGVAFKGTLDGAAWTGANQYLGENGPASADDCIKFEAIDGSKKWFKATYKLGAEAWGDDAILLAGKICLIYTDDGSWQGQAVNWEYNEEYTTADVSTSGDGNIQVHGSGLVYVKVGGWQTSECVAPSDYKITVLVPAFCDGEFDIELIGSFCGWSDDATVALVKVEGQKYQATINATPNAEWKVRGKGGWDKEIQGYVEAEDKWVGVANNVLGEDKEVTMDYSDAEKYRWNVCGDDEEGGDQE